MNFRNDIQQLRGISVLIVVLFHLQVPFFGGGFLGVDLFFVISGFLMAVLYDKDRKLEFFSKRAKRLLPAYFVTIVISLIAAFIITTPNEFGQVTVQSIYASLFLSNIGFWLDISYFDKSAFSLLLHLWSLGVEIQFYLIVPILAWLFRKHRFMLPTLFLISLLMCYFVVQISAKTAFFMIPPRLWEFLAGFFVAAHLTNKGGVKFKDKTWIGMVSFVVLCLMPVMNVDGEALSFMGGHPGFHALLVVMLGSLVLIFGLPILLSAVKAGEMPG